MRNRRLDTVRQTSPWEVNIPRFSQYKRLSVPVCGFARCLSHSYKCVLNWTDFPAKSIKCIRKWCQHSFVSYSPSQQPRSVPQEVGGGRNCHEMKNYLLIVIPSKNILFLHFALLIHINDFTLYFFYLNVYRFLCYIRGMSPIPCRFSKTRQRQYNVTIGFIVININISLPLSILRVISSSEWRNSPR